MQNCKSKFKTDLTTRCYLFSIDVIKLSDLLPKKRSSFVIEDQLIRSATSVGANLIEAKSSSSRLEFKRYNEISLRSANETKYWLCLLRDAMLVDKKVIDPLLDEVSEISNMLASGILKLKQKKF